MSEIDGGDAGDGGGLPGPGGLTEAAIVAGAACLSCGGEVRGPYCSSCGQKNDDLRRSSFMLAKGFIEDTFSFDSRMWRTLGFLAISPGRVPKEYAHGRRSLFTPPVRLYLVVSFLFFLTISLTHTLFVALEVEFRDVVPAKLEEALPAANDADVELSEEQALNCNFQGRLQFFVKEKDLQTDLARLDECIGDTQRQARERTAAANEAANKPADDAEIDNATQTVSRIFTGLGMAASNPRKFNDAFNDWLPRVLFFMTPILALILALFLRRGVLFFDHLVLSFYSHAAGFAVIGASLILARFGAPFMGAAAFVIMAVYYIAELKRTYGRGWVKTLWTAAMSGMIYLFTLFGIVIAILSNIVWRATA
ncbi:MAG TPA: DUF3667 domain-containing protein [Amphiplicatus sp.]|nr:DUF3667 domain-containing protein [Amphiplicatus sp.]MCB9956133.1 DUF3667 domain-containing protein [Caulobacterales bacterium]HOP18440.1 DUF3667 domain-containing protein [Amphiplicatus sp.]